MAHVVSDDGDDPCVFVLSVPDGVPMALVGSAAVTWLCAVEGEGDLAETVGEVVGLDRELIDADVEAFVADLVNRGFLEPSGGVMASHDPSLPSADETDGGVRSS